MVVVLSPGAASAADVYNSPAVAEGVPQEVSINAHSVRGCPTADSCVFTATGAIDDHGVIKLESVQAHALPSPVVGTAQYVRTFIGTKGSLTIRLESRIRPTDDPAVAREEGRWVVVSATGSYASLNGWGSESGSFNFETASLDVTYVGYVH